jgi:lipopolysaccharide/colanic/teichoic acid biosynthesis glycosyltransferase
MILVCPRPQLREYLSLYTAYELRMVVARPGITDLASIVFSDEGEILAGSPDPDLLYAQIIRPWKSRLALLYVDRGSWIVDLQILLWTATALLSRPRALLRVGGLLEVWGASEMLLGVATRTAPLLAYPPPGASAV